MKLTEVAALGFRLFGLYLLMKLITGFIAWTATNGQLSQPGLSIPQVALVYLLPLAISLVLIALPITLAKACVPSSALPSPEVQLEPSALLRAGTVILGIYFVCRGIPDFIYNLMVLSTFDSRFESAQSPERAQIIASEVTTIVEISLGLYLTFGSQGLLHLIERFRGAGLPKDPLPPSS